MDPQILIFLSIWKKNSSHSFFSFPHVTGWNSGFSHRIPHWLLAAGCRPVLQRIPLAWAPFWNFKGPHCLRNGDKLPCHENFPVRIILIFWAQTELLAGLGNTSALRLWWTKRLRMSSWLIAVVIRKLLAQRLCQRARQKFCHLLLKVSPPFHQSQGFHSPQFQMMLLRNQMILGRLGDLVG